MSYDSQKTFFEQAYKTGSDLWTKIPFSMKGDELFKNLQPGSMVLDLGSGRGYFPFELVKQGYNVIGLDYLQSVVDFANERVADLGIAGKARFVVGDVLDIPFADVSFDAVCDIGLLQHMLRDDWTTYRDEVLRVLKPGGYFFLITYAKMTQKFFSFAPVLDPYGDYTNDGVHHHFFSQDELMTLWSDSLELVSVKNETLMVHGDRVTYYVLLMKKK